MPTEILEEESENDAGEAHEDDIIDMEVDDTMEYGNEDVEDSEHVDEREDDVEDLQDKSEASATGLQLPLDDSPQTSLYDEGILGLARIMVYRKKDKYPELQATEDSSNANQFPAWVDHFSKHGHATPTPKFHHQVRQMDSAFLMLHKDSVDKDKCVIQRFTKQVAQLGVDLPLKLIKAFGKLRLYVRLRVLNTRKNRSKKAVLRVNAKEKWNKNSRAAKKLKHVTS